MTSDIRDHLEYLTAEVESLKMKNKSLEDLIGKQGKYLNQLQQDINDEG